MAWQKEPFRGIPPAALARRVVWHRVLLGLYIGGAQGRTWFEAARLPTVVKPKDWVEPFGTTSASELAFAGNLGSDRSYL